MTQPLVQVALSESEARALTNQIKDSAESLWRLLLRAYEGKAWQPLGYPSFDAYAKAEFDMKRRYAYYILNQGKVIEAIELAAGVHNCAQEEGEAQIIHLTEFEAREIAPIIENVTTRIREEVIDVPQAEVQSVVQRVVQEERAKIAVKQQLQSENAELHRSLGLPMDKQSVATREAESVLVVGLFNSIAHISKCPPPEEFMGLIEACELYRLAEIRRAIQWLDNLATLAEGRK